MLMGYVDEVRWDRILGWAADLDAPDEALELVILVNGSEAGRVRADRLRLDLRNLGKFGEGKHGFAFNFAPPLDPASDHDVVVRFAASEAALTRGAFKIRRQDAVAADRPVPPAVEFYEWSPTGKRSTTVRPRYVLHVGMPKTGTKYLQSTFSRLRAQLRSAGVYYPTEWWEDDATFAHHDLARDLHHAGDSRIAEIFAQLNACGSETVLLSSEGFDPVPDRGLEYLRDLIKGSPVEIVFYARRWSDWIPSQWQQAVKQGSRQTFPEWYAALISDGNRHPGINQRIFLDKFARIFGRENLRLMSYSNLMDHKVDIVQHFCENILHVTGALARQGGGKIVHESMGITLTELMRNLNSREVIRGKAPGYHVFQAFAQIRADPRLAGEVERVLAAMEKHLTELIVDDNAWFFQSIYSWLDDYRDCLVTPEYGANVFERRSRNCRYVRSDYLMEEGLAEAVGRLHQALRERVDQRTASVAAG